MRRRQEDIDAIVGTVVVFTSVRTHERAVLRMYLNTTTRFVGLLVVAADNIPRRSVVTTAFFAQGTIYEVVRTTTIVTSPTVCVLAAGRFVSFSWAYLSFTRWLPSVGRRKLNLRACAWLTASRGLAALAEVRFLVLVRTFVGLCVLFRRTRIFSFPNTAVRSHICSRWILPSPHTGLRLPGSLASEWSATG